MSALLWFAGIVLGIYWTFRLFGRQLLQLGLRQLLRQVQKNMREEHFRFEQRYQEEPFRQNIYSDAQVKVSAPQQARRRRVEEDEIAEDVRFEEL